VPKLAFFLLIIPMGAIGYSPARSDLYTTCNRNKTFGKVSSRFLKSKV